MDLFEVKPADVLNAWRDAVRAAELAERLASDAAQAADAADVRSLASAELAELAQQAADASARAAARAAATAAEAALLARQLRENIPGARQTLDVANASEAEARAAYHDAEAETRGDTPQA
ncbi:MAG TPA: hypothetical protein VMZ90_13850 [Vicinamibacterales bacterium]|nr:hypothetical protein [Vicinamibacterales bacterium]